MHRRRMTPDNLASLTEATAEVVQTKHLPVSTAQAATLYLLAGSWLHHFTGWVCVKSDHFLVLMGCSKGKGEDFLGAVSILT